MCGDDDHLLHHRSIILCAMRAYRIAWHSHLAHKHTPHAAHRTHIIIYSYLRLLFPRTLHRPMRNSAGNKKVAKHIYVPLEERKNGETFLFRNNCFFSRFGITPNDRFSFLPFVNYTILCSLFRYCIPHT